MKRHDRITLFSGEHATVIRGSESTYKRIYIVQLENGERRVVDRTDLSLVPRTGQDSSRYPALYQK